MKTLPMAIISAALLVLTACAGDSGERAANIMDGTAPAANSTTDNAAGSSATGAPRDKTYSGFDIAGIYLGMSPDEVIAALKAHDPDIIVRQEAINFTYNALGKRYTTDSFVHYMIGNLPGGALSLDVRFSYPPEPLTVVMVSRGHRQQVEPISQALYVESLVEKYGTPARDSGSVTTGQRIERTLYWPIGNGTTQCLPEGAETNSTPPILDRIQRRLPDATPESVKTCASVLRYVLRGDPVVQANGAMLDVAAMAKAEFASQEWIQSLIDEKSKAGTERPRL